MQDFPCTDHSPTSDKLGAFLPSSKVATSLHWAVPVLLTSLKPRPSSSSTSIALVQVKQAPSLPLTPSWCAAVQGTQDQAVWKEQSWKAQHFALRLWALLEFSVVSAPLEPALVLPALLVLAMPLAASQVDCPKALPAQPRCIHISNYSYTAYTHTIILKF